MNARFVNYQPFEDVSVSESLKSEETVELSIKNNCLKQKF